MIVISPPQQMPGEQKWIHALFKEGLSLLHVRKPGMDRELMQQWLEGIDPAFRDRLVLHQHHDLARELGISRLHYPEHMRAQINPEQLLIDMVYSTSVHEIEIFNRLPEYYRYAFIGPVYESISKPGYRPATSFTDQLPERSNRDIALVALGGINLHTMQMLVDKDFQDLGVLGSIWCRENPVYAWQQMMVFQKKYMNYELS